MVAPRHRDLRPSVAAPVFGVFNQDNVPTFRDAARGRRGSWHRSNAAGEKPVKRARCGTTVCLRLRHGHDYLPLAGLYIPSSSPEPDVFAANVVS